METRDDLYCNQEKLNNLLLLKIAHRAGVDMRIFESFIPNESFISYHAWDSFTTVIFHIFEVCEYIGPYDDGNKAEKEYWSNLANLNYYSDSTGLIILLDDRIKPFEEGSFGGYTSEWYTGYANFHCIEKGIIIDYCEDDGSIDWTDVFSYLMEIIQKSSDQKESVNYEVAV